MIHRKADTAPLIICRNSQCDWCRYWASASGCEEDVSVAAAQKTKAFVEVLPGL